MPASQSVFLFDAVGTLIHPEPSVAVAYHAAGLRHGSCLAIDEVDRRFRRAFAAEEALDAASGSLRTDEARELRRWRSIVAAVFDDVPTAAHEELFQDLWDHFARPTSWRAFDDAAATLEALQRRGATIAVGSNFDARLAPIVAELLPMVPPANVFASSTLGYRKPAPEFFAACLAKLDLREPGELLIVGDDADNDFFGPRKLGYPALLLDRRDRHNEVTDRISSLADLFEST
ncbi:MAG: HAD family hydrolase [Planctomycetes bacterium]|nr:HAD family hydrolase [Planctomycetota bacterium]